MKNNTLWQGIYNKTEVRVRLHPGNRCVVETFNTKIPAWRPVQDDVSEAVFRALFLIQHKKLQQISDTTQDFLNSTTLQEIK